MYKLLHVKKDWYDHVTVKVQKMNKLSFSGTSVQTDHVIKVRRPDLVVKDKKLDHTWITDIALLRDGKLKEKEKRS